MSVSVASPIQTPQIPEAFYKVNIEIEAPTPTEDVQSSEVPPSTDSEVLASEATVAPPLPDTRVAIVTGAAQGIGLAIALRLAADGHNVAINDIPSKAEQLKELVGQIEGLGRKAVVVMGDVTVEEEVAGMVGKCVAELGRLDVMVANAGIAGGGAILEADIAEWEKVTTINIRGVLLCYKYAGLQMAQQGLGGRLISASSICGKRGFAYLGAYCASKFAVRAITQCAAQEMRDYGITVNSYAPGIIDTAMVSQPGDQELGGRGEALKRLMRIPDAQVGEPSAIANLVSFLASPQSHFITGQTITADGGVLFD